MPARTTVSAAEFVRNFGFWQERALLQPISITHHGRERLVLAGAEAFSDAAGPASADTRAVKSVEARLAAVLDNMSEGFIALAEDLTIMQVNRVAETYFGVNREQLTGASFAAAFPSVQNSLLIEKIRRVMRSREAIKLDTDQFVFVGRALALQIFPLLGGVGILFSNMTEYAELAHEVTGTRAIAAGVAGHAHISTARCDESGRFVAVDDKLCQWIRFEPSVVLRTKLADLVAPAARRAITATFDDVLSTQRTAQLNVAFLARDLQETMLDLSLSPLSNGERTAGVCIVATDLPYTCANAAPPAT